MASRKTSAAYRPRNSSDRLDADELMQLLRRNLWLMLLVVAAVMAATAAYLSVQPEEYRARAAMVLTNKEIRVNQIDTQLQSSDLTRTRIETELDVLRSRNFASRVAEDLRLFANPAFVTPQDLISEDGSHLAADLPAETAQSPDHRRAVVDKLLSSYSLHRSGESLVITVQAEALSAPLAADIANGVVTSFVSMSRENQTDVIDDSTRYLRQQADARGDELAERQVELAAFIREHALDDKEAPEKLRSERNNLASVLEGLRRRGVGNGAEARRINGELSKLEAALAERTRNELTLTRMERSVELLSTRYQTAVERLNDLEPQRELVQPDARQITVAERPVKPFWPNTVTTLVLAFPVGVVLAFVLALLRGAINRQIWDGAQATAISDLPNLGTLPRIRRRGLLARSHDPTWFIRAYPRSAFTEALRSLVTMWSSQRDHDAQSQLTMVTSGLPDEGKSTVSTSFAATAAEDGLRTLLVDFDTRRRGATRIMGATPLVETADQILSGDVSLDEALIQIDGFQHFHLLAFARGIQMTPGMLRGFEETLLPRLRAAYDLIVVDTPPALAVADALRFGRLADDVIIVVRSGRTTERVLRNCIEKLSGSSMNVLGTVINDVEPRRYRRLNEGGRYGYY